MPPLSMIKKPFELAGRVGKAVEMAVTGVIHPEQILSKSPITKNLYSLTVEQERLANLMRRKFTGEVDKIVKTYGINDQNAEQFLSLVEFYNYNKRLPNPQEAAQFPKWMFKAAAEHLTNVTDPMWKEYAKTSDPKTYKEIFKSVGMGFDPAFKVKPKIGYVPGYFTHFPVKSHVKFLGDEMNHIRELLRNTKIDDPNFFNYKAQLMDLQRNLDRYSKLDTSLNTLRYKILPEGGYFGPLSETRQTLKEWGYKKDYQDVMHEYVDKGVRKIFLDKYLPVAKELVDAEPNTALRQYAFDYVTAQRGALASKSRVFLNESLAQLFPDPESGYRNVAKGVDFATRFQYLSKIGLSWFRFPFVNATQPLLTTYPMVGAKNLFLAYAEDLRNPAIWKEAFEKGVIFEEQLRKGLVEALGRTPKLTKFESALSWPARISEELNRVVSYAAGKRTAVEIGLKGEDVVKYGINLVNRTQFLYSKAGMPLIMSKSPLGRLVFQFRTFTSNYVNFLTQLWREGKHTEFAKALGSLGALSGTAVVPFGIWEGTRRGLLRNAGIDIGELNPAEFVTEKMGFSPPLNFGQSFEPFNAPSEITQMLGPTIGPFAKLFFDWQRRPELAGEHLQRFLESATSPPITRLVKGLITSPTVRMEPTLQHPEGRKIGERSLAETLFVRPPLEATRRRYMTLMANAMAGGREDLVKGFMQKAKGMGVIFSQEDLNQVKAQASKMRGVPKMIQLPPPLHPTGTIKTVTLGTPSSEANPFSIQRQ